jgi:hypothetical protein
MVYQCAIDAFKVLSPREEPAADYGVGHEVTALGHAGGHTGKCQLDAGKLEEKELHVVSGRLPCWNLPSVGQARKGRLEGETASLPDTFTDFFDDQTPRTDGCGFGLKRRQARGNQIGIDEVRASCLLGQVLAGERSLPSPVRPGDDQDPSLSAHELHLDLR